MWSNPFNVPDEADLIRKPELDVPLWSENLYFFAHDGAAGICAFAHMSRLSPDPRIWEGNFVLTLPDGRVLVNRSVGYSPDIAWTGQLGLDCVVPNRRWRWRFDGVAQETDSLQMATQARLPDARVPVRLDLEFDAVHPVWSMKEMEGQAWANFHTEQGGIFKGNVSWGNETPVALDCMGWRDHSAGPRDYSFLQGNVMAVCTFPSRRVLQATLIWSGEAPSYDLLNFGYMIDGEDIRPLKTISAPSLVSPDGEPRDVRFELDIAGSQSILTGRALNAVTQSLMRPQGMEFGYIPIDPQTSLFCSSPMRFEWDGEVGFGWMDRVLRIEHIDGTIAAPKLEKVVEQVD